MPSTWHPSCGLNNELLITTCRLASAVPKTKPE
jgi:hypothetical protein